jgi:hypothetical protein
MTWTKSNEFGLYIHSLGADVQPSTTYGTSITPGSNTYNSYTSLIAGASVTDDVYEILICTTSNNVSAAQRDTLLTIGLDPAGGTSFTDSINHLLVSNASNYLTTLPGSAGITYVFPLFIKAGTSIGAKASVNNATVGTLRCFVILSCKPSRPDLLRVGSFVRTFGEVTASSCGTSVTPGTTSKGSYVQLGSALAEPLWYWEVGFGCNDSTATMGNQMFHLDVAIGDASNKRIVVPDCPISTSASETASKPIWGYPAQAAIGDLVYGRAQGGGSGGDTFSMIAYGVGG